MAHTKRHGPAPVPPANRPRAGLPENEAAQDELGSGSTAAQNEETKRHIGGFEGAGQHPRQQPSQRNDGQQHSR